MNLYLLFSDFVKVQTVWGKESYLLSVLRRASLHNIQCIQEETMHEEFVSELLETRDGLMHIDILSENEALELIQTA